MKKCVIIALAAFAGMSSFADTLRLKSGTVLTGTIVGSTGDAIKFKSDDFGELDVPKGSIVQAADVAAKPVEVATIEPIPVPPETWHGSINGAFTASRGNTYEDSWSLVATLNRRWDSDRLSLSGGYYFSKTGTADGPRETTTDRWELEGQEDHFWSKAFYSYVNLRYEHDEIAQLDARYRAGLGLGYQWLDGVVFESTGKWSFSQELGLNWIKEVHENSEIDKQDGFAALRYAHHLNYLPKWSDNVEVFHNLEYLPEVDDWDKYLVKADIGFTTKIIGDFDLLAKIEWDYDSIPANDRKKSDVRYIIGLGYKW